MNYICKNLVSYISQWLYWTKCWDGHLATGVLLALNSQVVKEVTLLLDPDCQWEAGFLWHSSGSEDVSVRLHCCDQIHVPGWFMKNRSFSQSWMLKVRGQEVSQTGSARARFRAADFLRDVVSRGGRAEDCSGVSFIKRRIPLVRAPPSWHSHLSEALLPNTITSGIRFSTWTLEGHSSTFTLYRFGIQEMLWSSLSASCSGTKVYRKLEKQEQQQKKIRQLTRDLEPSEMKFWLPV